MARFAESTSRPTTLGTVMVLATMVDDVGDGLVSLLVQEAVMTSWIARRATRIKRIDYLTSRLPPVSIEPCVGSALL
jgi:hypothetical protein